jgi:hypothetical protein
MKNLITSLFVSILILISPLSYSSLLTDKMSSTQSQTINKTENTDGAEGKTITKQEFQKTIVTSETFPLVEKFMNLKPREQQIVIGTVLVILIVCFGFIRYFMTGKQ